MLKNLYKTFSHLKKFKWWLFFIGFLCIERFCHKQTDGFRPFKIYSDLLYNPSWDTGSINEQEKNELKVIFSQPFHFLGSGGQCYAFCSNDQKYVIKFFKHHHMRPKSCLNYLPLPTFLEPGRKRIIRKRKQTLHQIFNSCKIAHDFLKQETGLIYLHLNKSHLFQQKVELIDKIGTAHLVDLDTTEFILQKKAEINSKSIKGLLKQGQVDVVKQRLSAILSMIYSRCKAGIIDMDPAIKRNFAFLGEKPIQIDICSFQKDEFFSREHIFKREFYFETAKLRKWIKKRSPELFLFIEAQTKQLLIQQENK